MATTSVRPTVEKPVTTLPAPDRSPLGALPHEFDVRSLRRRRFRIVAYFTGVFIHFLWWEWILRFPVLSAFRTPWVPRWQRLTARYKELALELQGLWVKLGQFLSTRVDVLPIEITRELESLRDEVPPESTEAVIGQIEAAFGCRIESVFAWLAPHPMGSASLAQVHRAQTLAGDSVVVKVLRPGIREIIRADLKLLRKVSRWLALLRPIARRANVNAIVDEFDGVTTRELDLRLEARNLELFADDFAADPGVATPRVYPEQSSESTLTMEDVSYIRIDDLAALEHVGIDRKSVARKVYNVYLRQFFVTYRIHADPHPGNLFIRPMPTAGELDEHPPFWRGFSPGDPVPYAEGRPFQLVVVDFGMMVEMPARLRDGLREFAIGLGTRDAHRILDAYSKVGVLLPGADLDRVEEMIQAQLDDFWGTFLGQMRESDLSGPQAMAFFEKYEGLLASTPFQFQTEMLFMTRAMGILSGVTANLDPKFDPWTETSPFAQRLIQEAVTKAIRSSFEDIISGRIPSILGLLLRVVPSLQQRVPNTSVAENASANEVRRLRRTLKRLIAIVATCGVMAVGAALQLKGIHLSNTVRLLWPGNDLGHWIVEVGAVSLLIILIKRDP